MLCNEFLAFTFPQIFNDVQDKALRLLIPFNGEILQQSRELLAIIVR